MKKFVALAFCVLGTYYAFAQCNSCTPSFTSTCPPSGGLCAKLDTVYVNQPFSKVIPFYMPRFINPNQISTPCGGCTSIKLRRIDVTGVSGLPGGFQTPYFSQNGSYNIQNGDTIGCATFCGTPLVAGTYVITVYLLADVTAIGTPIGDVDADDQNQQYSDTVVVLPDTSSGVTTFTYGSGGSSACNTITVNLQATKQAPAPNLTRYFWNIAGTQTEVKNPGQFTFNNTSGTKSDTFPISLKTVFYNYRIKSVNAQLNSGWYPDINEATSLQDPEPYLRIIQTGYQSHNCNNTAPSTKNPSYTNINQELTPGTFTVDMEIWDDDNCGLLPIFASPDDKIGDYDVTVQLGTFPLFDNLNNSTGTVVIDTVPGVILTDTLWVVVHPTPPVPVVLASRDTFCSNDSIRISIQGNYAGYSFEWWRDTVFLSGINDSAFFTNAAGNYKVKVTNLSTGCQNISTFKSVTVMQGVDPITVIDNGTKLFITPFPNGMKARWYYNGNLITGQDGKFLDYVGNGSYYAEVYNPAFPACSAVAEPIVVNGVGFDNVPSAGIIGLQVYPNPGTGLFTVSYATDGEHAVRIRITDAIGSIIREMQQEQQYGKQELKIDLTDLAKGVYILQLEKNGHHLNTRLLLQ
ncbi:MAG: T9SS type A sorting domain-containing protein [Chitinophagales bacterium]|nr:T9SS type A sorting domain-containing protein [Chitinophagales bacterium]